MLSFADFIRSDKYSNLQRSKIVNLHDKSKLLQSKEVQVRSQISAAPNTLLYKLLSQKNQDLTYKLEKLRLKIIDDDFSYKVHFNKFSRNTKESNRLAWIFIMCLLKGKDNLLLLNMLQEKGFDVNMSLMSVSYLPSYYFFAHICKNYESLHNGKKTTTWNGIPLCVYSRKNYTEYEIVSLTSITQYKLMLELKVIFDCIYNNSTTIWKQNSLQKLLEKYNTCNNETGLYNAHEKYERAVYLADYLAMNNDIEGLKDLDLTNQTVNFSFLVQTNLDLVLNMLKKNFCHYQSLKNITPLHYVAMKGDLVLLALYLEAGLCANALDLNGNTPLHYAAVYGNINCYDYLTKRIYKSIQRRDFVPSNEEIKNKEGKTALQLLGPKNIDEKVENPECHLVIYKKNLNEVIEKAPRFKVVAVKRNYVRNVPNHIEARIVKLEAIRIEKDMVYGANEAYYYMNILTEKTKSKNNKQKPQLNYIKMMEGYELDHFYDFLN